MITWSIDIIPYMDEIEAEDYPIDAGDLEDVSKVAYAGMFSDSYKLAVF
jgi:hypothetical protein